MTVASDGPLPADAISGALGDAGGYQVARTPAQSE